MSKLTDKEKLEITERALWDICKPLEYLEREANEQGYMVNYRMAHLLIETGSFYQSIAGRALGKIATGKADK